MIFKSMRFTKTIIGFGLFVALACLAQVPYHNSLVWRAQQWKSAPSGPTWNDPSGLTNIALWLVASDITNSPVSVWYDRIGYHHATQTTASRRPYTNGSGGLGFYLTNWIQFTNPITLKSAGSDGEASILIVVKIAAYADSQVILEADSGVYWDAWVVWSGEWRIFSTPDTVLTLNKPYEWLLARSPTYLNGVYYADGSASGNALNSIGSHGGTQYFLNGTLYELIVWTNAAWTAGAISNVNWYCTNTYPSIN